MIKLTCSAVLISFILLNLPIISADAGIPADIVVAAWTFDGTGETVVDISGNGHEGGIFGNAERVDDGVFGKAILFPGSVDSYVQVPDHPDLNIEDSISLIAWFKGSANGADLVGKDEGPPSLNRHYNIHITGTNAGKVYLSGTTVTATTTVIDDEWHHIAGTWDGKTAKIYIDGEMEGEAPFSGRLSTSDVPVEMGRRSVQGLSINGLVDDVAIFSAALTEAQIQEIIEKGLAQLINLAVEPAGKLTIAWSAIRVFPLSPK